MAEARLRHPYADFLTGVEKPSRYIGGEYQEVRKDLSAVKARVCLAFPDTYEIGMSHLGTKILYSVLNKTADIACERVFSPWLDMEGELRKRGMPLLTLESASPLGDFDVVGFSLQYELTYTNVLNLLDLGGMPLRTADRGDDAPLILAGGPTATHPEPLAPFIDAFFIGEAEEHLPALVLEAAALRRLGVPRRERLVQLAARYPLYVPELYATEIDADTGFIVVGAPLDPRVPARPKRVWVADINKFPFPDDSPLPYAEAIFDRMAVEVARGCTEGCRFCQAGMIYRPVRERDPVAVLEALSGGVRKGGYDETSLTSLSTADYSCVTPLVKAAMARLREEKVSLSVSSLRAYGLNEDLLAEMATMKAQGLTFAPEAGTQRMRDVITKNVTDDDITESAQRVFSRGFRRMKLYFMIGLPTEQDEDVQGIIETAARVQEIGRSYARAAQVTTSVSTHVPKPHTPFQWCAMDTETDTRRKQKMLASSARAARVDLKMHENYQSHLEGIFSRGDRACGDLLERAYRLGCRFDGWDDVLQIAHWERAIEEERAAHGFMPERYLGTIPVTAKLPWDHIDIGLEPDFLVKEYRKALKDRLSPPCGKPFKQLLHATNVAEAEAGRKKKLVCYDCGVACDLEAMKDERLFFLRRMNAWTPPVAPVKVVRAKRAAPLAEPGTVMDQPGAQDDAAADGALASEEASPAGGRRAVPRPPTRIQQESPTRYRLRYTKVGRAAYFGHLDLIRHLPRVFRRAGLDLFYSVGFHPKPDFSFGPALNLGVPSVGEVLDVKLIEDVEPSELVRRLNAVTLDGVRFVAAAALDQHDRGLGRVMARAEYAAFIPDPATVQMARAVYLSGAPLTVLRQPSGENAKAGIARTIDVRRPLIEVGVPTEAQTAALERALGWTRGRVFTFALTVSNEGSARPVEVVEALAGAEIAVQAEIARTGLLGHGMAGELLDLMDLPALRAAAVLITSPDVATPAAVAVT